jgi:hypothetical protein
MWALWHHSLGRWDRGTLQMHVLLTSMSVLLCARTDLARGRTAVQELLPKPRKREASGHFDV